MASRNAMRVHVWFIIVVSISAYSIPAADKRVNSCQLANSSLWRGQQLQQVLNVLRKVRLSKQELTTQQLEQLMEQLQLLYDCLRLARHGNGERNQKDQSHRNEVMQGHREEGHPWTAEELGLHEQHGALWSRQDHLLMGSGNGRTDNAYSSGYPRPVSQELIMEVPHGMSKNTDMNKQSEPLSSSSWGEKDDESWMFGSTNDLDKQYHSELMTHFNANGNERQNNVMSIPNTLEELNEVIRDLRQSTLTPYQSAIGSMIEAHQDPPTSFNSPDFSPSSNGRPSFVSGGGGGIQDPLRSALLNSGAGAVTSSHQCNCLSRGSMLGLIASGVAATALTAYINALFQQSTGGRREGSRRLSRGVFPHMARSLLRDTCSLVKQIESENNGQSHIARMFGSHNISPEYVPITMNVSEVPLSGTKSERHRREVKVNGHLRDPYYDVVKFNLLDAPLRKSAEDPGPWLLLEDLSKDDFNLLSKIVLPQHDPSLEHDPSRLPVGASKIMAEGDQLGKSSHTLSEMNGKGPSDLALPLKDSKQKNREDWNSPQYDRKHDHQNTYINFDMSQNVLETAAEMPPTDNEDISQSSADYSVKGGGTMLNRIEKTSVLYGKARDSIYEVNSSADYYDIDNNVVTDMLTGHIPQQQLGIFSEIFNAFHVTNNTGAPYSGRRGRYTKKTYLSPLTRVRNFFLGTWRRNGVQASRCGCVTLDSKQLGYIGSPVQALVMSGVVLGYVVIQSLALHSRNGRSSAESVNMQHINKLVLSDLTDLKKGPSPGENTLQLFIKLLNSATVDASRIPVIGELKKMLEATSIGCRRYYLCRSIRQAELAGEPISVAVPLLQLPLSWLLSDNGEGSFVDFCIVDTEQKCKMLRKFCTKT